MHKYGVLNIEFKLFCNMKIEKIVLLKEAFESTLVCKYIILFNHSLFIFPY